MHFGAQIRVDATKILTRRELAVVLGDHAAAIPAIGDNNSYGYADAQLWFRVDSSNGFYIANYWDAKTYGGLQELYSWDSMYVYLIPGWNNISVQTDAFGYDFVEAIANAPEPSTLTLAALGLVSFGGMAWQKRRRTA